MPETRERWRNRLPHWEVSARAHFITIRCAGSLPESARQRIKEIHADLAEIEPATPEFAQLQRQYFLTCEKYLDHPTSNCFAPFRNSTVAEQVLNDLHTFRTHGGWLVQAASIMPNHVHLLISPQNDAEANPLREVIRAFKGRTARQANLRLNRKGAFWQREWFDRWMRDEHEVNRVTDYIRQNPVKAGLVERSEDWRWQI